MSGDGVRGVDVFPHDQIRFVSIACSPHGTLYAVDAHGRLWGAFTEWTQIRRPTEADGDREDARLAVPRFNPEGA